MEESLALPIHVTSTMQQQFDVAVVGAGVFGAWSAYKLRLAGAEVVLLDAYGTGSRQCGWRDQHHSVLHVSSCYMRIVARPLIHTGLQPGDGRTLMLETVSTVFDAETSGVRENR